MILTDRYRAAQFYLRDRLWGRWDFRKSYPQLDEPNENELTYYTLLLERSFPKDQAHTVTSAWDIGCRNWSYIKALSNFFPKAELTGIEVDGGRRYWNMYRRIDLARAHAASLVFEGRFAQCLHEDFRKVALEAYIDSNDLTCFCFFFPFVSVDPCLKWGLPTRFADWVSQLKHVKEGVQKTGGKAFLWSCHQGSWEAEIAEHAYTELGIQNTQPIWIDSSAFSHLWPNKYSVASFFVPL